MAALNDIEAAAHHQLRDGEYFLTIATQQSKLLKIQVEDEATGEQWIGQFDAQYVEELTHKTGNFKEFDIFCSMLESGVNKTSESITLDMMTYTDLEALRNKKIGGSKKKESSKSAKNSALNNKRFLIVTYTVEFDRIHYPLSLNYVGKFDPFSMRKLLKQQKEEIRDLKLKLENALNMSMRNAQDHDSSFDRLLQEKEAICEELEMCKRFMSKNGVAKELRILKKVISSLESDLLKERSRHQRGIFKKNDECKRLAEELEGVRSSERNLRVRVKNLTEEIAILKRSAKDSSQMQASAFGSRFSRKTSVHRSSSKERPISSSIERKYTTPSPSGSTRFDPTAYIEEKRKRQMESEGRRRRNPWSVRRSRSASLERFAAFPSSRSKERPPSKRRDLSRRGPNRSSSVGSVGSRNSSIDSVTGRTSSFKKNKTPRTFSRDRSFGSIPKKESRKSVLRSMVSSCESETETSYRKNPTTHKRRGSKSKTSSKHRHQDEKDIEVRGQDGDDNLNKSLDIAEIDARLSALQRFMKSNLDDI